MTRTEETHFLAKFETGQKIFRFSNYNLVLFGVPITIVRSGAINGGVITTFELYMGCNRRIK